jgi:hypothetical protein
MIEQRLKETLGRVAAAEPGEAGAYDRFLRRRARRTRAAAGGTALVLVLLLGSVAAVPRLLDRLRSDDPGRRLFAFGQAGPATWRPGPLVAVAPVQGFEVDVPAGWEATPTWKGFALRPADPARRGLLPGDVQVDTAYLEAFYNPAGNDLYHDTSQPPARAPFQIRQDPQSRGRFPDGRGWFRTDGVDGRWRTTQWYVSWPYHCQGGERCPDVFAMRALRVAFTADAAAAPQVLGLAERLLRSARPITNAVQGQAHAPRPDCLVDRSVVASRNVEAYPFKGATSEVVFFWHFRTTRYLTPCALRVRLGVELLDRRGRAHVRGNGVVMQPVAALPEGSELQLNKTGTASPYLDWTNWCGPRSVRARWLDPMLGDAEVPDLPVPRCEDPTKPSVLMAHPGG